MMAETETMQKPKPPEAWNWVSNQCARCGRGPDALLNRHHEKKDGKRTGRWVPLCRDCHNLMEGMLTKRAVQAILKHASECEECSQKLDGMKKHAGVEIVAESKPVAVQKVRKEIPW